MIIIECNSLAGTCWRFACFWHCSHGPTYSWQSFAIEGQYAPCIRSTTSSFRLLGEHHKFLHVFLESEQRKFKQGDWIVFSWFLQFFLQTHFDDESHKYWNYFLSRLFFKQFVCLIENLFDQKFFFKTVLNPQLFRKQIYNCEIKGVRDRRITQEIYPSSPSTREQHLVPLTWRIFPLYN